MKKKEKALEKKRWTAAAWDMLYLVRCGINSVVPDPERVAKMDLEKVYIRSKMQSLEALAYMALESLRQSNQEIYLSDEKHVLPQWEEAKNKAIVKTLMMDAAREQLFAFLEEQGIWHVALKGSVLCHMYPKYGMRQMADNDILFDPAFRQEVHDWFVEQGYQVQAFNQFYHDIYLKKPVYNFEMHTVLFPKTMQVPFKKYYLTIKDKLIAVPGKSFEYRMTDEDFYLYMLAHQYKHYLINGTGLRCILDLYVCLQSKLNWEYLTLELKRTELFVFEKEMRELAQKVFDPKWKVDDLTKKEKILLESLVFSCTYGSNNDLRHKLFPDQTYMELWCQQYAPYLFEHQWLIPVAPFWRLIKRGIERRGQIKQELDALRKA